MNVTYPENWSEIATDIKQKASYRCQRCGLQCLTQSQKYPNLSKRIKSKYTAQVHHWDRQPSNNHLNNLVCLCAACHIHYHRGNKSNITTGQLSLPLKLTEKYISDSIESNQQLCLPIEISEVEKNINIGTQLIIKFSSDLETKK